MHKEMKKMRELETERLRLRRITADDTQTIYDNWATDPEVTKYLTWNPHESIDVTRRIMKYWLDEYEKPETYRYGIELKSDGTLIGMIDVVGYEDGVPAVGYCSGRKWWGNGYMTEALKALNTELLADGYTEIKIEALTENIGSNRVIQKAGYDFVGTRETPLSAVKPEIVTVNTYIFHG